MDSGVLDAPNLPNVLHRLLPAVGPVLLVAIGYVDPGKWAATIEGGARFGLDLIVLMLLFNLAAILCQYLSARIALVTGRDLAQICSDEYDKYTCVFIGVQTELSMILLDISMILGMAHGLNLLLGVDLFTCVFLTAVDAVLYPLFATFLDNSKAKFICMSMAGFILLSYFLGILISQPEIPLSMNGMFMKFNGESAFTLMSLLGANIMPHNFYLHSAIVQQHQGQHNVAKGALFYDHFLSIFCVYSGIYLVAYILMNSAAHGFYGTGLGLLTFQDALSLMEQVFRTPALSIALLFLLCFADQITALTWNLVGELVLHDFFGLGIPGWLHRATIRIIAIVPSLYCVWSSGAEGMYQLLIFTQVMVALLLPSSVIPLFRVAWSRPIMGAYKISQLMEFLAVITFVGMLGLNIVFVTEMMFGNSDWVSNLRWNMGSSTSASYVGLLIISLASICLMLWLMATPLKSATSQMDAQVWNWDEQQAVSSNTSTRREESDFREPRYQVQESIQNLEPRYQVQESIQNLEPRYQVQESIQNLEPRYQVQESIQNLEPRYQFQESIQNPEQLPALEKSIQTCANIPTEKFDINLPETIMEDDLPALEKSIQTCANIPTEKFDINLPETIMEDDQEIHSTAIKESHYHLSFPCTPVFDPEESVSSEMSVPASTVGEGTNGELPDTGTVKAELVEAVKNAGEVDRDLRSGKDDDEGDTWDHEDLSKGVSGSTQSLASDGPGSYRSLGGKGDEGGTGAGSLSRLAGLGRAARRQLAAALDEFWGQLYDFHGQATNDAKVKKLDVVLGADTKATTLSQKVDNAGKEFAGYSPSVGGRGADSLVNSSLYDPLKLQRVQSSVESSYGGVHASSMTRSNHMQLLDAYVQSSSHNVVDAGERRYSSMRSLPSSDSYDYQPATVHGYQIASYLSRMGGKDSPMETTPKSPSLGPMNYRGGSNAFAMGQKLQNGASSVLASGFQNLSASRNSQLQFERQYIDTRSSVPANNVVNTKEYHSLPDISGLSAPIREQYKAEKVARWGVAPPGFESSVAGRKYEPPMYSSIGSRVDAPLGFNELSPSSNAYRDAFSPRLSSRPITGSLWSRQPFEQFGVADKGSGVGSEGTGSRSGSIAHETTTVESEAKLLQSFRSCIMKLLKLEGSDWLFKQNDGSDEDLIDRVAARERFICEAETREMSRVAYTGEPQYPYPDRRFGSAMKHDDMGFTSSVSSVPNCGEGCIWRADLIISFGVWCIHRILDLSLMESRPELWGKYTYVLNRLQGIVEVAFSKPRTPMSPCFCLQIPAGQQQQQRLSPPVSNGMLPPASKPGRGKCTNAASLLEIIKDVEMAISYRKGKTGTAAGDVAFPKGKENLASVLKRYKRRLSNKTGVQEGPGSRKAATTLAPYGPLLFF